MNQTKKNHWSGGRRSRAPYGEGTCERYKGSYSGERKADVLEGSLRLRQRKRRMEASQVD